MQLALRVNHAESDELVLSGQILQILLDVLSELSQGDHAISLITLPPGENSGSR